MRETIIEQAAEHGFSRVYFAALQKLPQWKLRAQLGGVDVHGLTADPAATYPWAKCLLILVWGYAPYPLETRIPAYYVASNASYHAAKRVMESLRANGARAEFAQVPVRDALLAAGVGAMGKNGLMRLAGLGTRFVLQAVVTDACEPCVYHEPGEACGECTRCMEACPMGAIKPDGLHVQSCMRYHMETAQHVDEIKDRLVQYLGCEVCQAVCPHNATQKTVVPPCEVVAAFDMEKLTAGDAAAARKMVGKNLTGNGKLTAEAIVFAARDGRYDLVSVQDVPVAFAAVRDALRYAEEKCKKTR